MPMISICSPTLTMPCSIRPVTTVPRPWMLKTSSTGREKGRSKALTGSGIYSSIACIKFKMAFLCNTHTPSQAWQTSANAKELAARALHGAQHASLGKLNAVASADVCKAQHVPLLLLQLLWPELSKCYVVMQQNTH